MCSADILRLMDKHEDEAVALLKTLACIPAPSGREEQRAAFCLEWLHAHGVTQAYTDEIHNVLIPFGVNDTAPLTVFCAHSDVVFPDTEPFSVHEADGKLYCPGIGDDTANVAALMMTAACLCEAGVSPTDHGLLLVINVGEEGLGNLKGTRRLMQMYAQRVSAFISFDCHADELIVDAVGSSRYSIAVDTVGGHSYFDFGRPNANAVLASVINELYEIKPPAGATYNVGCIQGGTSVNTVAQHAEMLFELRSDSAEALEHLQTQLDAVLARHQAADIRFTVTLLGERPCARGVDAARQAALADRASAAVKRHFSAEPVRKAGSTDCNIPLSMGIPSVCFGCALGDGMHTREEYVELESLCAGLHLALDMVLSFIE